MHTSNSHKELTINRHAMHMEECVIFYYTLAYKLTVSNNDIIHYFVPQDEVFKVCFKHF